MTLYLYFLPDFLSWTITSHFLRLHSLDAFFAAPAGEREWSILPEERGETTLKERWDICNRKRKKL